MERLDFSLPDFVRLSWVSDSAQTVWAPRFRRLTQAWSEIEWLAVAAGIRPCSVTMASPEAFVAQAGKWAGRGLSALPLEIQGLSDQPYSNTRVPAEGGKPLVFRLVIGTPPAVSDFKRAWDESDQQLIGRLLGYPPCCHDFFHRVWVDQGLIDTTWPMAIATAAPAGQTRSVEVAGPPEANILWRWMGVRPVPHLPCRFDCPSTVSLGREFLAVGREAGYEAEMEWLLEILSWPVEWSALHGIAEIKTPLLKVSTRTDATPWKYVVRRRGEMYPPEGARGLTFPYLRPDRLSLSHSPGFQRGLDNSNSAPPPQSPDRPVWYAADNGFKAVEAMDAAHRPLIDLATATLAGAGGPVLDLGCGNGALLKKLRTANPGLIPFGIDLESDQIKHAHLLLPEFATNFVVGDMFECSLVWPENRRYKLAILMPGRLLEAGPERAARLKERLKKQCDYLLVYAYEDWLTRYENLQGLAERAGLVLSNPTANAAAGLARLN